MESLAFPARRFGALVCIPGAEQLAMFSAAAISALAASAFSYFALARYAGFNSTAFDLGFFDQVVWQIAHGRPGLTSYLYWYDFFGQHFEPVLYLYGAFYKVWADPRLLLVSQGLAVGCAAWFLYLAARELLSPWLSTAVAAAFLLATPLHAALAFDFHPEVMGCLPLFAGLCLALRGRIWRAAACWSSLLLLKEDEALILPALALLLYLICRRRTPAFVLAAAGLAWAAIVVVIVEPHWRHGFPSDLVQNYGWLGGNFGAALSTGVRHPLNCLGQVFGHGGAGAIGGWIAGLGLAPLMAPLGLLVSAPALLLQMASSNPNQHGLQLHYGVEAVPLAYAYLLVELGWLKRRPWLSSGMVAAILALAIAAFLLVSPFRPGAPTAVSSTSQLQAIRSGIALVPSDVGLRADSTLAAHLSQREQIYEFPGPDWGTYVVLDAPAFHPGQAWNHGYSAAAAALPAQSYIKIYDEQGVQVWRR